MSDTTLQQIKSGLKLDTVKRALGVDQNPREELMGTERFRVMKFDDLGIAIFFDSVDTVSSVRFACPFSAAINGVKIGASQKDVEMCCGKPQRGWPIKDGIDRWLYDSPEFMRIDFDPETDLVKYIFR